MEGAPIRLNRCPLVDALVEIRFQSKLDSPILFAKIYEQVKDIFNKEAKTLPLSQIPEIILRSDRSLMYKPLYRIEGNDAIMQICPQSLTVSSVMPYVGWDKLSSITIKVIRKLIDANIITNVPRLGHRYVNFFTGEIDKNLTISLPDISKYSVAGKVLNYSIMDGDFMHTLQISNAAQYSPAKNIAPRNGSVIDIDTYRVYQDTKYFIANVEEEMNDAHHKEKMLFFSLLSEDFTNRLEPIYE